MRIIAGQFRGRRLLPPDTSATRPITDRVKQSLFDILSPRIEGAQVYDCFAGTGSMGLECLSRGCRFVTFFESDRSALKRLRENLQALSLSGRGAVVPGDLMKWAQSAPPAQQPIDLIFLDPPYRMSVDDPQSLSKLTARLASNHLAKSGIVIFRHNIQDNIELPALRRYDARDYGPMRIEFLTHPEA